MVRPPRAERSRARTLKHTQYASEQAFLLRRDLEFESGLLQRGVMQTIEPSAVGALQSPLSAWRKLRLGKTLVSSIEGGPTVSDRTVVRISRE